MSDTGCLSHASVTIALRCIGDRRVSGTDDAAAAADASSNGLERVRLIGEEKSSGCVGDVA